MMGLSFVKISDIDWLNHDEQAGKSKQNADVY